MPMLFPDETALAVRQRYKPELIKGDMDSVREEVSQFYRALILHLDSSFVSLLAEVLEIHMGTRVVDASDDQDTTDLHKCIAYIRDLPNLKNENASTCVLVAGALGGRFDHEAGNINVLCHFSSTQIVLLSDDCLIQLLPSSHLHEIHIHPTIEGPHCGLVPIRGPSKSSTTTGLQWNLSDTEMKFGGLISTSNLAKDEIVTVRSDSDLLWTVSLKKIG
ncbi:hypothetical protein SASPL_120022 [Salvia splendens]|uniref:thiamine diphosphokinase n=1 Tax=Salvia splendens TaxID=180675 RepID=A0A8X8XTR6_SALSN|nr:hypothetical protein SASPL_120022 [Salvia splendens]